MCLHCILDPQLASSRDQHGGAPVWPREGKKVLVVGVVGVRRQVAEEEKGWLAMARMGGDGDELGSSWRDDGGDGGHGA